MIRIQKIKENLTQQGRSMIEMLSVLAVIGVLSILGIAGYKKAMLKYQANELMKLAQILYNEATARAMTLPDKLVSEMTTEEKNKFRLYLTTSANPDTIGAIGNMGLTKPSFMSHDYFNIIVNLVPSSYTGRYYRNQPYHQIRFVGMNDDCSICEQLKSFTEKNSDVEYRYFPKKQEGDFWGIQVSCYRGGTGKEMGPTCFKSTDTD